MIDLEFVESLIRAIDESSIDSVEIERGGTRIRISKTPSDGAATGAPGGAGAHVQAPAGGGATAPAPGTTAGASAGGGGGGAPDDSASAQAEEEGASDGDDGLIEVTSPMVGTFYRAPAPDAPPYVEIGDQVAEGETLCIIEAMKLMNELESEMTGTIREICVENAEPVEYGQALFRVEPS